MWSGVKHNFDITNVPHNIGAYQELVDVAAASFGFKAIGMKGV